jgi:hypothetical protein
VTGEVVRGREREYKGIQRQNKKSKRARATTNTGLEVIVRTVKVELQLLHRDRLSLLLGLPLPLLGPERRTSLDHQLLEPSVGVDLVKLLERVGEAADDDDG